MTLDEEIAVLKAQNAELVAVNGALAARVQELAAQNAELRARRHVPAARATRLWPVWLRVLRQDYALPDP
jgi:hypothetical protein